MVVCVCLQEALPYGISGTVICTLILYFKNDNSATLFYRQGSRALGSVGGGGGQNPALEFSKYASQT